MRTVGTQARGIRLPIINKGDDLVEIVAKAVVESSRAEGYQLNDRDIVGVTESVVARAQGNYATIDQIAEDVAAKYPDGEVGVVFPILSRNRFSMLLLGIARGVKKVYLQLSYPSDEVGNPILTWDELDEKGINPYTDTLTEEEFYKYFGHGAIHPFTGIDYIKYYKELVEGITIIFSNDPRAILRYTPHVLAADIHTRFRTKRLLKQAGARTVYGLDDILTRPVNGSGYHPQYGLLGSNKASETTVKLFPRDGEEFVNRLQARLKELTGKHMEVMIYGDGAFKDPVSGIWELADPVVSPAYTKGLEGTPNEVKLKYLADNMDDKENIEEKIREIIRSKDKNLVGRMISQGTTPRRLTDLLGSLCDLVSGSGDKGTPVVLIQGYFDNYATDGE
ncbi:coenzyme F420-0:L-glutamate ligase [Caldicoprobacter algeriensis]|uniref:coenzyme F420-0:L-glutamate ligase n=1 Tax=Caldicoprobacter algeriensis TaxID=699281 RepID=UPI0020798D1B|nr:coenzyme F420-0:L-glutamate ligase [Caldicoprobacter algeriensis]MCM8901152.1 coenzyme F420-0:L-glutamate ligase [Caldicoprobacter algeriensis]